MSRKLRQSLIILLVGFAAGALGQESQVKSQDQSAVASSQSLVQSAGPEPRQITTGQNTGGISSQTGSQYPYNLYQNAVLSAAMPQTASSSGSWLSILRPSQGGRRASLTSRLRNIVGSIFRRDQSPYMAQGSSVSYSLRPPPSGFFGSLTSGLPSLSSVSGLGSSFGSGYSAGSQPNLFASASGYQPIVIPGGSSAYGLSAGQLAQAGKWSSYKGVTNDEVADATGQLTSVYNPSANYNWATSGSSGVSSYPSSSYGTSYSTGTGSSLGSGSTYQSSAASPASYQVASSSYNPSATYASSSYPSSGSSSYQRSSSSFKPIVSSTGSTSYSSGLVGSSSVPSPSYASSSSASNKPVQSTISVNSGANSVSGSYSAQ